LLIITSVGEITVSELPLNCRAQIAAWDVTDTMHIHVVTITLQQGAECTIQLSNRSLQNMAPDSSALYGRFLSGSVTTVNIFTLH